MGLINIGKPVSYAGYVHVLCFIWFLFTMITYYTGKKQAGIALYLFSSCSKTVSDHQQKCQVLLSLEALIKGENLCHDHKLIMVHILCIKRK